MSLREIAAPKKKAPVRTESGSSSVRYEKKIEVTDFAALPDIYKMINERKLDQAIKGGIRNIPGTEIVEKPIVSVRS